MLRINASKFVKLVKYLTMMTWLLSQHDGYEQLTTTRAVFVIGYFVHQVISILALASGACRNFQTLLYKGIVIAFIL